LSASALQPYAGFIAHGGAYHSDEVRRILADAHAHYEAQVRPLGGLAQPDTETSPGESAQQMLDALRYVVRFHDGLTPADIARIRSIVDKAAGGAT
jgi:hypothetical protein